MRRAEWIEKPQDPKKLLAYFLMEDRLVTCHPQDTALDVANKLYEWNCGAVPVVEEDKTLVGIVSEFDLLQLIEAEKDLGAIHVADIMTKEVVTIKEDLSFVDTLKLLQNHHLIRVPVVRGEKVIGVVARRDVLMGYIKAKDEKG